MILTLLVEAYMLTRKQHELLAFLVASLHKSDVTPSFEEMRKAVGLASKSGIHRLVSALEERGYIRRLANKARAIEILRTPSDMQMNITASNETDNVIRPAFGSPASVKSTKQADSSLGKAIDLPLLGRIAAGTPIEALSDPSATFSVPEALISSGEHFALEIVGDSMVEAGIHDGDTVIIKRTEIADSGDIVVALIEEHEATLKTLRKEPGRIGLEPANPNYQTRYFESEAVRIQGRLTGLIRRY
jgi:repressor LexA